MNAADELEATFDAYHARLMGLRSRYRWCERLRLASFAAGLGLLVLGRPVLAGAAAVCWFAFGILRDHYSLLMQREIARRSDEINRATREGMH